MNHRWIAAALSGILSAWSFALVPVRGGQPDAAAARGHAQSAQEETITGLWEVRTGIFRGPWSLTLVQTGKTLSGTIQQTFPVICATEPVAFEDGAVEKTEAGDVVSFALTSPQGDTITFKGLLNAARDAIAFDRSVDRLPPASRVPVRPVPPLTSAPDDDSGFLSRDGRNRFVAHRIDPATAPRPGCRIPDTPQHASAPPEVRRYVATTGVGFPPWTFDLSIRDGVVSGVVSEGRTDPTTRMTAAVSGPFSIADGRSDGATIDFSISLGEGARVATFHGTQSGAAIVFSRRMTVVSVLSGADPGVTGVLGQEGATRFTAVLDPSFVPTTVTPVSSGGGGDDVVTLEAIDTSYAAVPAAPAQIGDSSGRTAPTGFALARYHVGLAFEGRLVLTITDASGGRVRQFEVSATRGEHVALWDLRGDARGSDAAPLTTHTSLELATAEARAKLASDLVRLAADDPNQAATLVVRMAPLLAGPRDAAWAATTAIGPGAYFCALSRVDQGSSTTLASLPLEIRAGGAR